MRITITIDDQLYAQALAWLPDPMPPSELVRQALMAWIRSESTKHLVAMGGQAPNMADSHRVTLPQPPGSTLSSGSCMLDFSQPSVTEVRKRRMLSSPSNSRRVSAS